MASQNQQPAAPNSNAPSPTPSSTPKSAAGETGSSPPGIPFTKRGTPPAADENTKPTSPDAFFPGHDTLRSATTGPWQAFKKRYSQLWRPMRDFPPSGSVLVTGLVELEGSKAYVLIDVFAWWDPKEKKIDPRSTYLQVRQVRPKTLRPGRP